MDWICFIIEMEPDSIYKKDIMGQTPLHKVCNCYLKNHVDVVGKLLLHEHKVLKFNLNLKEEC